MKQPDPIPTSISTMNNITVRNCCIGGRKLSRAFSGSAGTSKNVVLVDGVRFVAMMAFH